MRADTRLPPYLPYPRFLLQADLPQTAKLLDTLLQKLYEDYALGRLPEKRHAKLSAQGEEAIALPFSKVEELTGRPLCKSAYKYASYWYPAQDRPLSNTIYNAGYDVDRVDLAAGIVYLTKAA